MAIKKVLFLLAISSLLMGCSTQKEPTNNTKEEDRIMHNESIYKDGVNINPDRNAITTHYTCLACGKDFSF